MSGYRNRIFGWAFALFCADLAGAAAPKPLGVFVKVDVETAIAGYPGSTSPTSGQLHSYLQNVYASLLADPAISGITAGERWDNIQPTNSTTYDWSYLDDVFLEAAAARKSVQLIITPGFDTPQWLLSQIPSCDALFNGGSAPANCGKVKFAGFPEEARADGTLLPLPWNATYQAGWANFLTALNARYGSNPAFVAIAIAGPVGASDEIIYPNDQNDTATQPSGLTPNNTWAALIQNSFPTNSAYRNTDQVFIDTWDQAIDTYERIFSGVTLFIGADTGNDLPGFSKQVTPHADNILYAQDCADFINGDKTQLMSCEAKTEILSYFVSVSGPNGKATQTGGMTASVPKTPGDIGIAGVKVLTSLSPAPAVPFSGGAEFDYPVSSANIQGVGCPDPNGGCTGLTVELAAYNVLSVFFYDTPAAGSYGGTAGTATIQYLDVPYTDVQYAQANPCAPAPSAFTGSLSLQDLLNRASHDLLAMANQPTPLPSPTCPADSSAPSISYVINAAGGSTTIAPNTWVQISGQNLSQAGDTRTWQTSDFVGNQMPTQLDQVSVTVNGKSAYIYYISPTQINVLTPPDPITGPVQVVVTGNGAASLPFTAQAQALSPSFFQFSGGPYVAAEHGDYSLLGPTSLYPGSSTPAMPGETVLLLGTGFGQTSTPVVSGSESQSGTLSPLPAVIIGGITAEVTYAGLISPGLFQINATVPTGAPSGDNTVIATQNGVETAPVVLINVQGPASAPSTVTLYVSPNGSDYWSGTLAAPNSTRTDGPLASFDRARALVQSISKTGLSAINVQFRGGTYYLPSTLMFTAADSGTASLSITYQNYPGETPVFSGGIRIQNWTNTGGNTWKATLPLSTQYFENLFYNGVRRLRPRLGGYLGTYYRFANSVYLNAPGPPAAAPNENCPLYISGSGWECFDRFQYDPADPIASTWKNLAPAAGNPCAQPAGNAALAGDIELLDWQQFSTPKLRISCVDAANHIVYLTGPTTINETRPGFVAGNRYIVENVQDALTQPGQFFVDRSATPWTLTYLANPGENPNTDLVMVPQLPQLLVASGLEYVTFQGLTFEHDNYAVPALGHRSSEMEPDIPGAVSFQNAQHITFDSGTVTQVSGTALEFISCVAKASPSDCAAVSASGATAYNTVQNSAFYDIGALGVLFGHPYTNVDNDANTPQFNLVQNNVVEGYGRIIPAAFGIAQGNGHDNVYTHNEVYDGYHTALSISEANGDTVKPNGVGNANNTISFNHVYNLLEGIMNDGGAIRIESGNSVYTGPGNAILNNKIHDVSDASIMDSNGYGGDGIYLDNQTGLVDVENNLVYRVSANTIFTPQGPASPDEASTVKNNIFAYGRGGMVSISNPYTDGVPPVIPLVWTFTNNIVYFDRSGTSNPSFSVQGGCLYPGGAAYPQFMFFNSNLYWRTDGSFGSDTKAFAVQTTAATSGSYAPCSGLAKDSTFYTFAQWQQKVDEDVLSVVQNPGFQNPAYPADDYSLPNGAPGVGFVVFDPNQAGRSNPEIEPPSVPPTFPIKTFNPATDY